jgi:hypothetical protein
MYDEEMNAVIGDAVHNYLSTQRGQQGRGGRQGAMGLMSRRGGPGAGPMGNDPRTNGVYQYPPLEALPQHKPAKLRSFVGLGVISWTGDTDSADKRTSITPQAPVRGERLVIDVVATAGAVGLVTVKLVEVGVEPQQADTSQPAPASMFAKDVTYGHIAMQVANPGIQIAVTLGITAPPGVSQTVTAAVGLFVEWVR